MNNQPDRKNSEEEENDNHHSDTESDTSSIEHNNDNHDNDDNDSIVGDNDSFDDGDDGDDNDSFDGGNDNDSFDGGDEIDLKKNDENRPFTIEDGNDDDDDLEEDYLQKINNIDEIKAMSKIVRDKFGNIIDPLHKTLPFITCYEKARILGERTKQLNQGAKAFVEVDNDVIDGYLIALKEFEEKKIPFIIQRPLPNGTSEYWRFCDLECFE